MASVAPTYVHTLGRTPPPLPTFSPSRCIVPPTHLLCAAVAPCAPGAHTLGRCHTDRSGFLGPWTNAPTTFSNLYFQELINNKWWVASAVYMCQWCEHV